VSSIRIILVDDQELVRTGFRMVLEAQPDMTVAGEAADGLAAVEMARRHPADVVVMDVRMPRLDGVEATRRICAAGELPRVLPDWWDQVIGRLGLAGRLRHPGDERLDESGVLHQLRGRGQERRRRRDPACARVP
jgi:Response regulator receiver domain